jgi:hypothetical protein
MRLYTIFVKKKKQFETCAIGFKDGETVPVDEIYINYPSKGHKRIMKWK